MPNQYIYIYVCVYVYMCAIELPCMYIIDIKYNSNIGYVYTSKVHYYCRYL